MTNNQEGNIFLDIYSCSSIFDSVSFKSSLFYGALATFTPLPAALSTSFYLTLSKGL